MKTETIAKSFLDAIDTADALEKMRRMVNAMNGTPAVLLGLLMAAFAVVTGALTWRLDWSSTHAWATGAAADIGGTLPSWAAPYLTIPVLIHLLTWAPTLAELFSPTLSRFGIRFADWLLFSCLIFDCYTDAPAVRSFVGTWRMEFLGPLETPGLFVANFVILILASCILQVIFFSLTYGAIGLLMSGKRSAKGGAYVNQ